MKNKVILKFKDTKLIAAFSVLIFLTILTGVIAAFQIDGLHNKVEALGKRNLRLEKAVLEMRVDNSIYAMGIRNYAYWRISRYLGAVPSAMNLNNIILAGESFKEHLRAYKYFSYLDKQKEWAKDIGDSFSELSLLGRQIINLVDEAQPAATEAAINNLLMIFENRLYKIDEFLDTTMGKSNLEEIDVQIAVAGRDKKTAVLFLAAVIFAAASIGILIASLVYRRRKQERIYREDFFRQLINLEESERKNLSMAVHDQMGQDLSALKIYLGLIGQDAQGNAIFSPGLKERLNQCKKIVSGLVDKSRNISFLLRPPELDEVGLVESIESLLLDYKQLTGVNYNYTRPQEELRLSSERNLLIYRLAQELLTNMAKHSRASTVWLKLSSFPQAVELFYKDDGLGFDFSEVEKRRYRRSEDKSKLGLLGLKERVELMEGRMRIDSTLGRGTEVTVRLHL